MSSYFKSLFGCKGDGAPEKRKKVLETNDNGKKGKTDTSMKGKDNSSSNKTEETVVEKDNGSLNKTEEPISQKDEDSFNKTEISLTEKNDCLFNESVKPMTDRESRSEGHNKNDENMKKDNNKEKSTASTLEECFGSVKVSKHDAIEVQRGLEGEIFEKLSEGCEVMNATKIPFSNLEGYLDYLQGAFEDIDDDVRKNINSKLFEEKAWNSKMVEWNFKKTDDSGIRYGLVAFGRSKDQQYVDCMYVLYKMDFVLAPHEIVTEKKFSWFKTLTSLKVEFIEKHVDAKLIQDIQNFFRVKALEKLYKEGYIESINFVDS